MTVRFVLAIAPDRQVGVLRQQRDQGQQALGVRTFHFAAIAASELLRSRGSERPCSGPREQRVARRQLRQPGVVEIAPRVVWLADATRWAAYRAEPRSFVSIT